MKQIFTLCCLLLVTTISFSQPHSAFQDGEWFKFKMSYSGILKAGTATLNVKEKTYNGRPVYHVVGKGWTSGPVGWFFKVDDRYESYFDKKTNLPYRFIRKIDEGGHTKDIEIKFDQDRGVANVENKKHNTLRSFSTEKDVQDMVSAFYYLRNNYDTDQLAEGDMISLNMFFDEENYKFKLKFLGRELLKTSFGNVRTMMFRPYVLAGRVFKEEESLTIWVSEDENKIPLLLKADLAVGSLRAELEAYKGLKHQFKIEF